MISYAQNFEDVMLWRALRTVEAGFYIDIGAQDPISDSVSKAFHDRGWKGIHVEPVGHYAEQLRAQRPGDHIIQAAVGGKAEMLRFFEIPGTGISTASPQIAKQHRARGFEPVETTVPSISLSAVFELASGGPIHWLKIDVEGFEKEVLASWDKSPARPWIVLVESTLPMTTVETYAKWERLLLRRDYQAVYFDGLNRFYVSGEHPELIEAFRAPPGVFDGFSISGSGSSSFHVAYRQELQARAASMVDEHKRQVDLLAAKSRAETEAVRLAFEEANSKAIALDQQLLQAKKTGEVIAENSAVALRQQQEELKSALSNLVSRERQANDQLIELQKQFEFRLNELSVALLGRLDQAGKERQAAEVWLLESQSKREEQLKSALAAAQSELNMLRAEHAAAAKQLAEARLGESHLREALEESKTRLESRTKESTEQLKLAFSDHQHEKQSLIRELENRETALQAATSEITALKREVAEALMHERRIAADERAKVELAGNEALEVERARAEAREKELEARQDAFLQDQKHERRIAADERAKVELAGKEALEVERNRAAAREKELEARLHAFLHDQKFREQVLEKRAAQARQSVESILRTLAERERQAGLQLLAIEQRSEAERKLSDEAHAQEVAREKANHHSAIALASARIAEQDATILEQAQWLERIRAEYASAQALAAARMAAQETQIAEQRLRLSAMEEDVHEFRNLLRQREMAFMAELQALRGHEEMQRMLLVNVHQQQTEGFNETINEYRKQIAEEATERAREASIAANANAELRAKIVGLELTSQEKDRLFAATTEALQLEIASFKQRVAAQQNAYSDEIAAMLANHADEAGIARKRESSLVEELAALRDLNEQLSTVRDSLTLKLHAERGAVLEADRQLGRAQADVHALMSSLSWRITLPLRWFADYPGPQQATYLPAPRPALNLPMPPTSQAVPEQRETGGIPQATDLEDAYIIEGDDMTAMPDTSDQPTPASLEELLASHDIDFVRGAYRALLKREPDPGGQANYLALVRRGYDKLGIVIDIGDSEEGRRVAASLPGLSEAIRQLKRSRKPIAGAYYRMVEALSPRKNVIDGSAAFESQTIALQRESVRRVARLGATVSQLQGANSELASGVKQVIDSQSALASRLEQLGSALESLRAAPPVQAQKQVDTAVAGQDSNSQPRADKTPFHEQLDRQVSAWKE